MNYDEQNSEIISLEDAHTISRAISMPVTWVLDAMNLGEIESVKWLGPKSSPVSPGGEDKIIINDKIEIKLLQKKPVKSDGGEHHVILAGLKDKKKQYCTLKRNGESVWSETGPSLPIDYSQLEHALENSRDTGIEKLAYVKVSNYQNDNYEENYYGDAWYDVKKKQYFFTLFTFLDKLYTNKATLFGATDRHAYFYLSINKFFDLKEDEMVPLLWITDLSSMRPVFFFRPTFLCNLEHNIKIRFTLFPGPKGPILKEEYYNEEPEETEKEDNPRVLVLQHNLESNKEGDSPLPILILNAIENLDDNLYDELEGWKNPVDSNLDVTESFYLKLEEVLSKYNPAYVFSYKSVLADIVRISFQNGSKLWFVSKAGFIAKDRKVDGKSLLPLILNINSNDNVTGYWTPYAENNPQEETSEVLPSLELYYQKDNEFSFLDKLGLIKSASPLDDGLYVSTYSGVIYLLDKFGNSFVYAIEKEWFTSQGDLSQLDNLLKEKKFCRIVKLQGCVYLGYLNRHISTKILYVDEHKLFYLIISKNEESCIDKDKPYIKKPGEKEEFSFLEINDSKQLLLYHEKQSKIYAYNGLNFEKLNELLRKDIVGIPFFGKSADPYIKPCTVISEISSTNYNKYDTSCIVFEKNFRIKYKLSLKQEKGKYLVRQLSLDDFFVDVIQMEEVLDTIEKYKKDLSDEFKDFNAEVIVSDVVPVSKNKGWVHVSEKKLFHLRNKTNSKALLLGFDGSKTYAYACMGAVSVIKIRCDRSYNTSTVIEADFIAPVSNQLLIQPSENMVIKSSVIDDLSCIKEVGMIILGPFLRGQYIHSTFWNKIDIALYVSNEMLKMKNMPVSIGFDEKETELYYLQRAENNLWVRRYGSMYGLCLFDFFDSGIIIPKQKFDFRIITQDGPNKTISRRKITDYYSKAKNAGDLMYCPKVPLKNAFD